MFTPLRIGKFVDEVMVTHGNTGILDTISTPIGFAKRFVILHRLILGLHRN